MTPDENANMIRQFTTLEKAIGGAVITLLGWVVFTTSNTYTSVEVIKAQVAILGQDRYTSTDAKRDQEITSEKLKSLDERVKKLGG